MARRDADGGRSPGDGGGRRRAAGTSRLSRREQRTIQRCLSTAIEAEDLIAMQAALAAGARLDGGEDGLPPLLAAAILGLQRPEGRWTSLMDRLFMAGADPNQGTGPRGAPILHHILGASRPWGSEPERVIQRLITLGADPRAVDDQGGGLVHAAARSGHPPHLRLALDLGVPGDGPDARGLRPLGALLQAAGLREGSWEDGIDLLLDAGARLESAGGTDRSAVDVLLSGPSPDPALLALLLKRGAAVDARGPGGRTPLHRAVEGRHLDLVAALLRAGADPKAIDELGRAPLDLLAGAEEEADEPGLRVRALLRTAGARTALTDPRGAEARRLLETLIPGEEEEGALADELRLVGLIAQGALDPNRGLPRLEGAPPLHACAGAGLLRATEALLAAGHDPGWRDRAGRTALHRAAARGRLAVLASLVEAGAPPDRPDDIGRTPLMAAAEGGDPRCVAELLRAGADPRLKGVDGRRAIDHAAGPLTAGIRALLSAGPPADDELALRLAPPLPRHPNGPASAFLAGLSSPSDRWAAAASRAPIERVTRCLLRSGAARVERDVLGRAVPCPADPVFVLRFDRGPWTWVLRALNRPDFDHRAAALRDFSLLRGLGAATCSFIGDERVSVCVDRGAEGQDVWTEQRQTDALLARRGVVTSPGRALRLPGSVREGLDGYFARHELWLPGMELDVLDGHAQLRLRLGEPASVLRADVLWGWPD